jgi:hypothetical protein
LGFDPAQHAEHLVERFDDTASRFVPAVVDLAEIQHLALNHLSSTLAKI